MASSNVSAPRRPQVRNHEGTVVAHNASALAELRRSTLAALLFENDFYNKGSAVAKRVAALVPQCSPVAVANLAIEAREAMHLRHMPLFLMRELARTARTDQTGHLVRSVLARVIQRPDEITEFLALYWADRKPGTKRNGGQKHGAHASDFPLSNAVRRGLADAFTKFGRYSLSKYRGDDKAIKLVDALRLVRPKPKDAEQSALWKELRTGTLKSTETWESELSAGKDKLETWTRLLTEQKLGGLALLKNLRNMLAAKVPVPTIQAAIATHPFERVLPFRFLSAVRYADVLAGDLSDAMLRAVDGMPKLAGHTVVLVDVSPSMNAAVSAKSEVTRMDAAAGMAVLCREVCQTATVMAFSNETAIVPSFRGLPLVDKIKNAVPSNGTMLGHAVMHASGVPYDRIIVLTDEESQDPVGAPRKDSKAYMVNLATSQYGVGGTNGWVSISGWSERVLDYVRAAEIEPVRP